MKLLQPPSYVSKVLPGGVLIDETSGGALYERRPSLSDWTNGNRGYVALVYTVPETGLSAFKAEAVARLARSYAHGVLIIGRPGENICALVDTNGENGIAAFDPMDDEKFSRVKGKTLVFKIKGAGDFEKKAIVELSNILKNSF